MPRNIAQWILLLLLAFVATPQHAQIALGVNAGITRLKFSGDSPNGLGSFVPQPGFSSSFRFDYRFNDAVAVSMQPGISYLRSKYVVMNDSGTSVVDSAYFTYNGISVPLHALVWSKNGRFYVLAGIEFSYALKFDQEIGNSLSSTTPEVRPYNFSVQFGAGFIIPLGKPYLSFEIRYSQGLVEINHSLVHQKDLLQRTTLTSMNFIVGLQFPLGNADVYKVKKNIR